MRLIRLQLGNVTALTDAAMDQILDHARAAYPDECCGWILASGTVRRCTNELSFSPSKGSRASTRTGRNGFSLGAHDSISLFESFTSSDPVRVIYHSHPNGNVEPSTEDIHGVARAGLHRIRELRHVIIAFRPAHPCEYAAYQALES